MDDSGLIAHCYRMLGSITEAVEIAGGVSGYGDATLACLARAGARPLPSDLAAPSAHPEGMLSESSETLWLEPIPEHLMDGRPIDLGLIAALQRIAPRERAATVLHDIEGWPSARITTLLGDVRPVPVVAAPPVVADEALLARYRAAFEEYDVPAIVSSSPTTRSGRCRRSRPGSAAPATSAASSPPTAPPNTPATSTSSR